MAELTALIQIRCDTYAAWAESDPVLDKGELAAVILSTANDNLNDTPDTVLFKLGNGSTRFSELGWTSSLSADVYEWAKAPTRPVYTLGDSDLRGFGSVASHNIETTITDSNNVPTSSAVISYLRNYILTLSKTEKTESLVFTGSANSESQITIPSGSLIKEVEIYFTAPTTRTSEGNVDLVKLGVGNVSDMTLVKLNDIDMETITTESLLPESFIFNGINKTTSQNNHIIVNSGELPGVSGTVYIKYI